MSSHLVAFGQKRTLSSTPVTHDELLDGYDIVVIFHSAEGLSKMGIVGYINPYFVAKIDHQISFTSAVLSSTSTPKWDNEEWIVRNVPSNAKLLVSIYDKDDKKSVDDYIGEFEIRNINDYRVPPDGQVIVGSFGRSSGRFHLSIQATKSSSESQQLPRYTFDGPCRYSRQDVLAIGGGLTTSDTDGVYSTWEVQLRRISLFFPSDQRQPWNQQYKPTREVFSNDPIVWTRQGTMKSSYPVHREQTLKHHENGRLTSVDDLWKLIFLDRTTQRIKPRVCNYIIDDNAWRFSETGHRFFTDSAVKHARLATCSDSVCYAGEFHLRPKFGWLRLDDEWELVFDNASGTYSPNAGLLVNLKKLLLFNFPGLNVITYDYKDPLLRESIEQLEMAAAKYNRSTTTTIGRRVFSHRLLT